MRLFSVVVKSPSNDLMVPVVNLAFHHALTANPAEPLKLLDRIVDQVYDILITKVHDGWVYRPVIGHTKRTGAILNKLMLRTAQNRPTSATGNVRSNLQAVGDEGGGIRGLIVKGRIETVVDLRAFA